MNHTFLDIENVRIDVENNNHPEWTKVSDNARGALETRPRSIGSSTDIVNIGQIGIDRTNTLYPASRNSNEKHRSQSKGRFCSIEEGLESTISNEAKDRITRIVNEAKSLSDVEKLFLYLRLPTGDATSDELRQTPTSCLHTSKRVEQGQAYTWIKSHLEEDSEICLPKQEVYEDYRQYCDNHSLRPLSTADFGKLMKCVFPNVKPRRLGQRGQSKYCYGGLRKKLDIERPSLPELEISPRKQQDQSNEDDELFTASCQLVLEWASKLFGQKFTGVRELSEYLLSNLYVNSKSVAAFTVIAAMQESGLPNLKVPSLFSNTTGGDRHKETQLQLQRKLQEREHIAKQKKILQKQREENQQKLKQAQDRQTPLITSPSMQQVMSSPARKIFVDSVADRNTKSNSSSTEQNTRSQSVVMVDVALSESSPDIDCQRPKSTTFVSTDIPSAKNSSTKIQNKDDLNAKNNDNKNSDILVHVDTESLMDTVQCVNAQTEIKRSDNMLQQRVDQISSDSDMDLNGEEAVEDQRVKSPFHTVTKPDVFSLIIDRSLSESDLKSADSPNPSDAWIVPTSTSQRTIDKRWNIPKSGSESDINIKTVCDISAKSLNASIHPDKSHFSAPAENVGQNDNLMHQVLKTPSMEQLTLSSKPSASIHTDTQTSSLAVSSVSSDRVHIVHNETSLFISQASSVSSRSAFVPFKVQSRKDQPFEITNQSRNPSLTNTQFVNEEKSSVENTASDSLNNERVDTTNCSQTLVVMTNNPSMNNFYELETVSKSCVSPGERPLLKVAPTIVVPVSGITTTASNTLTSTVTTYTGESLSAPSTLQSSPLTPKKTRSRFTPIRPKASPAKTVSSILKEQKTLSQPESEKYDKSKLVSALLKEKRAREAQLSSQNPGSGTSVVAATQVTTVIPQAVPISPFSGISAIQGGKIHVPVATNTGNPGEFYIILSANPSLNQNPIVTPSRSSSTPVTDTTNHAVCEASIISKDSCSTSSSIPPSTRSRTNSSSEREFESPMQLSQDILTISDLSDSSTNDDEKPSKLVKIVDSDQNVSSRPGSRCSVDRETPSLFGRKRKMTNSHNAEVNSSVANRQFIKRVNSVEDSEGIPNDSVQDFSSAIYQPCCSSSEISNREFQNSESSVPSNYEKSEKHTDSVTSSRGKSKFSELQHCPDIYDLEFDALLDSMPVDHLTLLKSDSPRHQMQSTAVGVTTSLSLRQSQQKLLKEKSLLDKRMKTFMQQRELVCEKSSSEMHGDGAVGNDIDNKKDGIVNVCPILDIGDTENRKNDERNMEIGGELPPDVADFITDAMTGIENASINGSEEDEETGMDRIVAVEYTNSPVITAYQQRTKSIQPSTGRHMDFCDGDLEQDKLMIIKKHLTINLQGSEDAMSSMKLNQNPSHSTHIMSSTAQNLYLQRSQSVTFSESQMPLTDVTRALPPVRAHSVTLADTPDNMDVTESFSKPRQHTVPQKPTSYSVSQNVSEKGKTKSSTRQINVIGQEIRGGKPADCTTNNNNFASPQRPLRRQRTPSVERNMNQTPTKFNSPVQLGAQKKIPKDPSVEYSHNQTAFSDPGYGSFVASPILTTTPVSSSTGLCDSTYSSMANSSLHSGRPESAQSLASDNVAPSPVSFASPRFQTSTPFPLRSPCPTPNQHILQSPGPVEGSGPIRAFMPIQLTSHQLNTNVTLIKPVVTIPNQQTGKKDNSSSDNGTQQIIQEDLIGIGSIEPKNQGRVTLPNARLPPPYTAAVQGLQQGAPNSMVTGLTSNDGAFDILKSSTGKNLATISKGHVGPQNVKHSLSQNLKINMPSSGQENMSEVYPFSFKLAQLSSRTLSSESDTSDSENAERILGAGNAEGKKMEANKMLNMNLPHNAYKKCPSKEQSIRSILGHLHSPLESPTKGGFKRSVSNVTPNNDGNVGVVSMQVDELPNANYTGTQPNMDISGILMNKEDIVLTGEDQDQISTLKMPDTDNVSGEVISDLGNVKFFPAVDEVEFSARRNLTDLLNEQCTELNEDDLQTTLDDLKSVDSQYFEHEFEFRVTKRQ